MFDRNDRLQGKPIAYMRENEGLGANYYGSGEVFQGWNGGIGHENRVFVDIPMRDGEDAHSKLMNNIGRHCYDRRVVFPPPIVQHKVADGCVPCHPITPTVPVQHHMYQQVRRMDGRPCRGEGMRQQKGAGQLIGVQYGNNHCQVPQQINNMNEQVYYAQHIPQEGTRQQSFLSPPPVYAPNQSPSLHPQPTDENAFNIPNKDEATTGKQKQKVGERRSKVINNTKQISTTIENFNIPLLFPITHQNSSQPEPEVYQYTENHQPPLNELIPLQQDQQICHQHSKVTVYRSINKQSIDLTLEDKTQSHFLHEGKNESTEDKVDNLMADLEDQKEKEVYRKAFDELKDLKNANSQLRHVFIRKIDKIIDKYSCSSKQVKIEQKEKEDGDENSFLFKTRQYLSLTKNMHFTS